jgi:hypothetical protein
MGQVMNAQLVGRKKFLVGQPRKRNPQQRLMVGMGAKRMVEEAAAISAFQLFHGFLLSFPELMMIS